MGNHGLRRLGLEDVVLLPLLQRSQIHIAGPRLWNGYVDISTQTELVVENILCDEWIALVGIGKLGRIHSEFFPQTVMNLSVNKLLRSEIDNRFTTNRLSALLCLLHLVAHPLLLSCEVSTLFLHCPFKFLSSGLGIVHNIDSAFKLLLGDTFLFLSWGVKSGEKLSIRKQFLVSIFL